MHVRHALGLRASLCGLLTAAACFFTSCRPTVPVQVADTTLTERIELRFLMSGMSPAEKEEVYYSLVGEDAALVLAATRPSAVTNAESGALVAQGELILTARLDPFDSARYAVEGHGQVAVYDGAQLLISAQFELGNSDAHAIDQLTRRQLVLPVRHRALLNPALLLGRSKLQLEGCRLAAPIRGNEARTVDCLSPGVGTPFAADYFVRMHFTEHIPGQVYALDRQRGHEVFRVRGDERKVFGCVRLEPIGAVPKLLDLRSREFVTPLRRGVEAPALVAYDEWQVEDVCRE